MNLKPPIAATNLISGLALLLCCLISMDASAQLQADFSVDKDAGCSPLSIKFSNTTTGASAAATWQWNFGNGNTSTLMQPGSVVYNNNPNFIDTTYYITLNAYNGCTTTQKRDSIKVFPNSKARFAVDTTRGCSPFVLHITNTSPGNNTSYYWDFGDGSTPSTATPSSGGIRAL